MSLQNPSVFTGIILITLLFFITALGLVFLAVIYNKVQKLHTQEKQMMQQQFESELLKTQIEVQEQTMQTIASDLHDNIGQLLSLTNLTLGSIDLKHPEKSAQKIDTSINLVHVSIKELRDLAKLFQGEQLIEIGLSHAIQQEINWLQKSERYIIDATIELSEVIAKAPNKDLIILRLLQEIFNNIIKHSEATHIEFNIYTADEKVYLNIKDNGIGFDIENVKKKKSGMGLNAMAKRVALINGEISINSTPLTGTTISIEIPYP